MSGIAIVALTLACFGWNALIRADEESIIPRAEDDTAKEVEFDSTLIAKFKVEEFATFTLPPDGEGPTYKLASVNADEVVVEFVDAEGKTHSVTIPKVGLAEE